MKPTSLSCLLAFLACASHSLCLAGEAPLVLDPKNPLLECLWDPDRPDGHAPIGVMGDHNHEAGEFMLSYRYMFMSMDGMRDGTSELSSDDVFALGFPVTPTSMDMEMHMLGLMFAPTDRLTLMAMTNYQSMTMDHVTRAGTMPRRLRGERFTTSSEAWGDTSLVALYKILDRNCARLHTKFGFSAPTGSIDQEDPGPLPYPMQTGSGTWDLLFGPTYLKQYDQWSWGAQANGRVRLGENHRDYTLGNQWSVTGWTALNLTDAICVSGRLEWLYQGEIEGADPRLNPGLVPTAVPSNFDRHRLDAAIGLNLFIPGGFLRGHRFAVEAGMPLYEHIGGPLLQTEYWIMAGWQKAF